MQWTSILAIYVLFWVMGCYIALRFGMKTGAEAGIEPVPGQAESAPAEFSPGKVILRGTLLGTAAFAMYYLNWTHGWITREDLDFMTLLIGANR